MKKKLFLLSAMFFYVHLANAQDLFTVIKVSGNIVIERTGSSLGIGTAFAQNENLLFKVPDSRAAVINPQRGRFLLTSDNLSDFRNSKSNFLPSASKISTRSPYSGSKITALKDQMEGNFVILNEMKILVDTTVFPLTEKKFLYISYEYNNKTVNKKLTFNSDTLIIKRNELLTVNGQVITDPQIDKMKLIYLKEGEPYVATPVSSFNPVFPDNKIISQEIGVIIDKMDKKSYDEKLNEVSAFIGEFYGKVDANSLENWLNKYLGLKK